MTLSLCIVARNEASFLRECIESALPISDEIVVVDTGSTDATCAIARQVGARLIRAAWPGDLGKAHSLPLAYAHGDWVLSLDGDEVLDPGSRHQVRELIESREREGFVFTVRNYMHDLNSKWRRVDSTDPLVKGALGYAPSAAVRLFRRRRAYSYSGLLHQSIAPSIIASGGKIGSTDIPIHHYGYLRFDRAKSSLYLALARRQVTLEPKSAQAWIDLGIVFLGKGQYLTSAAAAAFCHARSLGERPTASYFLARALIELRQPAAAVPFLREAIRGNSEDKLIFFDRADAWELLGLAYQGTDHAALAEDAYRRALKCRPNSPIALNNLADLLGERDAAKEGEQMAERLLGQYRGLSMAWATVGTVRLRVGNVKGACRAFETALGINPENLPARVNLAFAYQRAGRPRKAKRAYFLARECNGSPDARDRKLAEHLPADRPQLIRLRPLGEGAVVSLIESLAGGGGRVLVDGVDALKGRPQLVLCGEGGAYSGQALRAEIESARVQVRTVNNESDLWSILAQIQPAAVIHHWWAGGTFRGPVRVGAERWIAVGHAALPMPFGYDAYMVISAFHEQFQRHLPPARLARISNGVRLDTFGGQPRRARGRITIAMLSRLDTGKFPRRLLDYLSPLADLNTRVLIAGIGQRRFEIEPEISRRGLEKIVRFVGPIPSVQVPRFLSEADIGLHLTETHEEICSMTILEMMASGLPIVAEPKGCLPEMIVPGKNGFLARNEREVANYLRELIASPVRRLRMGRASRAMVKRYDFARFSAALRKLVAQQTPVTIRVPEQGSSGDLALCSSRRTAPAERHRRSRNNKWLPTSCYLICATPRSGSSLLCESLINTGLAGWPCEFFLRRAEKWCLSNWGETADIRQYVAWLFEDCSTPNGVFGAKIMPDQFRDLCTAMATPSRAQRSPHLRLQSLFPGLRYVWLTRRDKLRQAISRVRADQTGQRFQRDGAVDFLLPKPRFDREAIDRRLREIESEERKWLNFFDVSRVTPVVVVYEDLADDYEATAKRTLKQLGLAVPRQLWFGERQLLRQSDGLADDWVRRVRTGRGSN